MQAFFETHTFRRLTLRPACLLDFDKLVQGKRKVRFCYIKHVRLHIELEEYDCTVCKQEEDDTTIQR